MNDLERLPNIGPALARDLAAAGIGSPDALRAVGPTAAWRRIRRAVPDQGCLNELFALHGAVRGVRWHAIPRAERDAISAAARGEAAR